MTLGSHLSWHLSRETMAWLVWQCWHFSFPLWHWDQQEQIPVVTTRASSITGCQTLQFYTRGPRRVSLIWGVIWTRGPLRVSPISRVIWRTLMAVCHYISFATVIPGAPWCMACLCAQGLTKNKKVARSKIKDQDMYLSPMSSHGWMLKRWCHWNHRILPPSD